MKKITRTFRIPADLVERFDRAAEKEGINKTEVVVEAIRKFVERVENDQFWGDRFVYVGWLFAPELGKCQVHQAYLTVEKHIRSGSFPITVLNHERKTEVDGEMVRYDIENARVFIDFEEKVCRAQYYVCWIGGLVEKREIEFPITWTETEHSTGHVELTISPVARHRIDHA